VARQRLYYDD